MDPKPLKSVRTGHKGVVTKLLSKFEELKTNENVDVDDVISLDAAISQKQKTLTELNERKMEQTSEEDFAQELSESDEYMYLLDCQIRKIRKPAKQIETKSTQIMPTNVNVTLDPTVPRFEP